MYIHTHTLNTQNLTGSWFTLLHGTKQKTSVARDNRLRRTPHCRVVPLVNPSTDIL